MHLFGHKIISISLAFSGKNEIEKWPLRIWVQCMGLNVRTWSRPIYKHSCKIFFVKLIADYDLSSCFCSVLCLLCLCARLFICALGSPAGKGLTSWLSFVVSIMSLSLSHWYPGSGVVLDCIDS